jgi:hypothetical protein
MIDLNLTEVPSTKAQDANPTLTRWLDDKCISLDEGSHTTFFIGHQIEYYSDGDDSEVSRTVAFPIRVQKPVSRDAAINAAEMEAYQLNTAMEVASFTASMARKFRENPQDSEVLAHDEFIQWVKQELTKIGIS